MAKKKQTKTASTTTVSVRPQPTRDSSTIPRPRKLRARRRGEDFVIVDGALDLGIVPGDVVWCLSGADGRRYFAGLEEPRSGTISRTLVAGVFCPQHSAEFIDEAMEDLRAEGASAFQMREGTLWAFWPGEIPTVDVALSVARSAAEYGLANAVHPGWTRDGIIATRVHAGPPVPVAV
ncbi:hypothetical protein [Corynebacterium nasicanis]|uniref:Uncharacterized protein n=1 Tax=Corynebacterium nasicanis TaxID=1448267 RepID=A0ABW1QF93_9CORY